MIKHINNTYMTPLGYGSIQKYIPLVENIYLQEKKNCARDKEVYLAWPANELQWD